MPSAPGPAEPASSPNTTTPTTPTNAPAWSSHPATTGSPPPATRYCPAPASSTNRSSWQGTAATAFTQYAQSTSTYLGQVQTQADWLAEEGKKAASLLEGLRNAYAATGFERIGTLIKAMQEYEDKVNGMFSSCTNPEKALLAVIDTFVNYLADAEARHVEALAALIKIDEQERQERPDLGSRGHDTTPFPTPAVGADAWSERGGWKPDPARPAQ